MPKKDRHWYLKRNGFNQISKRHTFHQLFISYYVNEVRKKVWLSLLYSFVACHRVTFTNVMQ